MKIFPAVDILGGKCVQLVQGDRRTATVYGSPAECASRWISEGADALHVVNLDGAFGESFRNADAIRHLVRETGITLQLGGGIRSVEDAKGWLEVGIERVILGTLAVRSPESITVLADEAGSRRVMAGVDARGGRIAIEGWQETAGDYLVWAGEFERRGAGSLLFTNVDVEGLQRGIDPGPVRRLINEVRIPVTVAGGISGISDILSLCDAGAAGAVLGSALYSGKISLPEALEVCR
ncbi:MAG: 1-(5-phosphoribosyl)-5-[(5-phosphoribosylamino)methylideneamino]imidazole-4-carboxamide isomerase [Methanoregulaceae archaeon]|nr:1-(5-phosphoribosyl)-5-[(5-phosphoribosylamino)methylideneamino]imidazole-4-carboxamide isomerase [Methanoregulaceae archaeon]